jgi:hypothetical protein
LRFSFGQGTGYHNLFVITDNPYGLNSWHHIVVTYSGNELTTGIKIYVNGSSQTFTVLASNSIVGYNMTHTQPFTIGEYASGYRQPGKFDEVCLYNRALTQAEITDRYNGGTGRKVFLFQFQKVHVLSGHLY